jgi:predicted CXXCH cytochrome family protein
MGNKFGKGLAQYLHRATYAAVLAVGALGLAQQAGAQVVDTKHNLSATAPAAGSQGATRVNYYTGAGATTQVCVFCHTPHGAASAAAPLWQRAVKADNYYQTYGSVNASPTMDADQANVTVGSVSLACLSCHDGTQAINTMANKPGSGNVALGGTWALGNNLTNNGLSTTSMANLGGGIVDGDGKDLQNDHPIGIKYAGGFSYTTAGAVVTNGTFADPAFRPTSSTVVNNVPVWYVEKSVGNAAGRDKNDIQLYTRSTGGGNYQPYVECASCHDPHANAELFMRVPVAGSEICLTCHIK